MRSISISHYISTWFLSIFFPPNPALSGHQWPWYWLSKICISLFSMRKDHLDVSFYRRQIVKMEIHLVFHLRNKHVKTKIDLLLQRDLSFVAGKHGVHIMNLTSIIDELPVCYPFNVLPNVVACCVIHLVYQCLMQLRNLATFCKLNKILISTKMSVCFYEHINW